MSDYPWYLRILFWLQRRHYGRELSSALIWGRAPRVFIALSWMYGSIIRNSSPISNELKRLLILRVSQVNSCEFCIDLNSWLLLKGGASEVKMLELNNWEESRVFDQKERAALHYAEVVTTTKGEISDENKTLIRKYFNEAEVVEITAIVAFQNMSTKFNNAFGVEPQGYCKIK